jgi:predicted nucleotidyltransferase
LTDFAALLWAPAASDSEVIEIFGIRCRCLGLERLIEVKRAAGRPKDLEAILEERQRRA